MAAPHPGQDARRTATHLTLALLGYFFFVTAVITLSPFDFSLRRIRIMSGWCRPTSWRTSRCFCRSAFSDAACVEGGGADGHVVMLAALCSLLIESAQIFIRRRYVSPIDVMSNACGAWLGAACATGSNGGRSGIRGSSAASASTCRWWGFSICWCRNCG